MEGREDGDIDVAEGGEGEEGEYVSFDCVSLCCIRVE